MNSRLKDEIHYQLVNAAKAWFIKHSPIKTQLFNANLAADLELYSQNELNNLLIYFFQQEHPETIISNLTDNLLNSKDFKILILTSLTIGVSK